MNVKSNSLELALKLMENFKDVNMLTEATTKIVIITAP